MSDSRSRIIIVISAAILTVLLFFAPKNPSPVSSPESRTVAPGSLETQVNLPADQQKIFEALELALNNSKDHVEKKKALEAVARFFEQNKQPLQVALYYQKLAELGKTAKDWFEAGERFYRAAGFVKESQLAPVYQSAINAYSRALELNNNDENAKLKLGLCYVELGSDPMKGVGLLREVAEKNPKNIEAQLNLGFYSVKSGQFDKAIVRFNNVLKIDTGYTDAYVYLAQTYEMMQDTSNALNYYELYRSCVKDTMVSSQVGEYIRKFRKPFKK